MPMSLSHHILILAALALSPLALAAPPAQSQDHAGTGTMSNSMHHGKWQPRSHGHRGANAYSMHTLDQLDLTTTQHTDIRKLMHEDAAAVRPERQALMQKRQAFANATPGTSEYDTVTSELVKAESQAAEARVTRQANLRAKIYAELTPAQRTKLASLRAQHQQQMQKWRESHPMHHKTQPAASSAAAR